MFDGDTEYPLPVLVQTPETEKKDKYNHRHYEMQIICLIQEEVQEHLDRIHSGIPSGDRFAADELGFATSTLTLSCGSVASPLRHFPRRKSS